MQRAPVVSAIPPAVPFVALRVLIAEDNADCRESMEEVLQFLGHSCTTARDGAEAWEMHEAGRGDVILSDWAMPRMDGLVLCRRVRAEDPDQPYTHFIFVTGNKDEEHFADGTKAGANGFIAKPVDLYELKALLESAGRAVTHHRALEKGRTGR